MVYDICNSYPPTLYSLYNNSEAIILHTVRKDKSWPGSQVQVATLDNVVPPGAVAHEAFVAPSPTTSCLVLLVSVTGFNTAVVDDT